MMLGAVALVITMFCLFVGDDYRMVLELPEAICMGRVSGVLISAGRLIFSVLVRCRSASMSGPVAFRLMPISVCWSIFVVRVRLLRAYLCLRWRVCMWCFTVTVRLAIFLSISVSQRIRQRTVLVTLWNCSRTYSVDCTTACVAGLG